MRVPSTVLTLHLQSCTSMPTLTASNCPAVRGSLASCPHPLPLSRRRGEGRNVGRSTVRGLAMGDTAARIGRPRISAGAMERTFRGC